MSDKIVTENNLRVTKALSIRQPWASLIVAGVKDIENRSWRTTHRGPVLIHASQRMTRPDFDDAIRFLTRQFSPAAVTQLLPSYSYLLEMRGGIIGRCRIVDCVERHRSKWFVGGLALWSQTLNPCTSPHASGASDSSLPSCHDNQAKPPLLPRLVPGEVRVCPIRRLQPEGRRGATARTSP